MNKTQTSHFDAQPFSLEQLHRFCGTKKLAERLGCDLGEAILEAGNARNRGESEDTAFELMFWCGTLVLDDDEMCENGINLDDIGLLSSHKGYDETLDADIYLGETCEERKFIVVEWLWKEEQYALDAWWLERE